MKIPKLFDVFLDFFRHFSLIATDLVSVESGLGHETPETKPERKAGIGGVM